MTDNGAGSRIARPAAQGSPGKSHGDLLGPGWEELFWDMQRQPEGTGRKLFERYRSSGRAGWKFLLPVGESAVALVIGGGWDSVAIGIARSCRSVVVCDPSMRSLRSLQDRARHEGLANIHCILSRVKGALPVASGFDIAVIDGTLPGISPAGQRRSRSVHAALLAAVADVLRPQGVLYLAVENRMSYTRLKRRGHRVEFLRDLLMPWAGAPPALRPHHPETVTPVAYARSTCERLLREVGLDSIRGYCALPHHRIPGQIVTLDGQGGLAPQLPDHGGWRTKRKSDIRFLRRFGTSFSFVASSGGNSQPAFLDRFLTMLGDAGGRGPYECRRYLVRDTKAVLFLSDPVGGRGIAHLSFDPGQGQNIRNNASFLLGLEQLDLDGVTFPKLLCKGVFEGHDYSVESHLEGQSMSAILISPDPWRVIQDLARFLERLGQATRSDGGRQWLHFESRLREEVAQIGATLIDPGHRERFKAVGSYILEEASSRNLTTVWAHGDFGLGNCLGAPNSGSLSGVLDWEFAQRLGLPGWDLLRLFTIVRTERAAVPQGEIVGRLLAEGLEASESTIWNRYAESFGVERQEVPFLLLTSWLNRVSQSFRSRKRHMNVKWIDNYVIPVIESFESTTGRS
jgi:SAM-dependent methyltransferase